MKRLNVLGILLVACISSFFFVNKVEALFKTSTESKVNSFTIQDKGFYVVTHKQMDLNGEYTIVDSPNDEGEALLGTTIALSPRSYTGFKQPDLQTIVIGFGTQEVTYLYEREMYLLIIENENYVTTNTPSGQYYYGTNIYLLADETDSQGKTFKKWSDGSIDRGHTFEMTQDVTIKPIYDDPFIVEFETNGGSPAIPSRDIDPGTSIGSLPVVTRDDCELSEGSYDDRNCTYAYKFLGWYLEPTFETQVNEDYVPTENVVLYAKWTKVYYHDDEEEFKGHNFLDSEIALFSEENAGKDFIVRFTLDEMKNGQGVGGEKRAVLFSDLYENGPIFPGTMFRYDSDNKIKDFQIVANVKNVNNTYGGRLTSTVSDFEVGMTFVLMRESGKLYYSIDGGEHFIRYNDFSGFNSYFDTTATFGGEYNADNTPYRYFKGTMSNMTVEIIEPKTYTVHFDPNGGTGMMLDQEFPLHGSAPLTANSYERLAYMFSHWTTNADGTGDRYDNEQEVAQLGAENEVVTLYAQWVDAPRYTVHFDANGGQGTMDDQLFIYSVEQNLTTSTLTKEGYVFGSWNTSPDGSGTRYENGQAVKNLSSTDGGVVTLYAQYVRASYVLMGETTFDGVDDYINTGINIFDEDNYDRDFDISFTIVEIGPALNPVNENQTTVMNAKDETKTPDENKRVPGFATRFDWQNTNNIHFVSHWENNENHDYTLASTNAPVEVLYKRRGGIVTVEYTYNGRTVTKDVYNQNLAQLEPYSPLNIVFGAAQDKDQNYIRFFNGTIADIRVEVFD